MARLVGCARKLAILLSFEQVSDSDLEHALNEILYGPRDFWGVAMDGLVTRREAAQVIVARMETWLVVHVGDGTMPEQPPDWDPIVLEVESLLMGLRDH
ncbi:hypothetical protein D7W82_22705 [Corallococcus sp. CA049B]|uniref:hypothetical protein n=1 Tax=Corallococcus sp. CA049B TaxID=2316730 RepID=UPI000EA11625|nr:hypothetical protein [Corallococcus sp. CA049B]RKG84314.1 hypothetical protein D7W82_22705 [Corallococcus sp. CA049B]